MPASERGIVIYKIQKDSLATATYVTFFKVTYQFQRGQDVCAHVTLTHTDLISQEGRGWKTSVKHKLNQRNVTPV